MWLSSVRASGGWWASAERSDGSRRLFGGGARAGGHVISTRNWIITHTCGRHVSNEQCDNVAPSSRGRTAHATTWPRPRRSSGYRARDQRSAAFPRGPWQSHPRPAVPIRRRRARCTPHTAPFTKHRTTEQRNEWSELRSPPGRPRPAKASKH